MIFIRSPKELGLIAMSQRKQLKLSQLTVGQLVGVKQATVSAFENKPESTQLETLFKILSALDLELSLSPKNSLDLKKTEWDREW